MIIKGLGAYHDQDARRFSRTVHQPFGQARLGPLIARVGKGP
jgi:hypothetical protein